MAGYTESFGAGGSDAWVLKLDNNGNIIWQKTYGGNNNDDVRSIYQTSDGGYIAAGTIFTEWKSDVTLLKLDSKGEIPNCKIIGMSNASVSNTLVSGTSSTIIPQEINLSYNNDSLGSQDSSIEVSAICCYDADDYDCDSIPNSEDNCMQRQNQDQADTCPPQGNAIGDACDCEGNFDCDGDVDGTDALTFKINFGRNPDYYFNPCTGLNPCPGDFDCDQDVDGTDATLFKADYGRSSFRNSCPACKEGDYNCVETCKTHDDCDTEYYCEKPIGQCDALGACSRMTIGCPSIYAPVCGCDDITYGNGYDAARNGASIDYFGPCTQ
jgi:hypothetical protein